MRNTAAYLCLTLGLIAGSVALADVQPDFVDPPDPPYTIEALRTWHRALGHWPWHYPPEQEVHLRDTGPGQLLICSEGGARSGDFVLFARAKGGWHSIGEVGQSHHPIRVLRESREGWHDFETFSPLWGSGGNEVFVAHYRWNGGSYERYSSSEGMYCDYQPFKSSPEFANACR